MSSITFAYVWTHSDVDSPEKKILLLAIADECDFDGFGVMSFADLTRKSGMTVEDVSKHVRELVDNGDIRVRELPQPLPCGATHEFQIVFRRCL